MTAPARAIDAVVFDLDGTLVDSMPHIALAMQAALARFGVTRTLDELSPIIGPPMEVMAAQLGASPDDAKLIDVEYRRVYDTQYIQQTAPLPGAHALLDRLDAARLPYGILTNKIESSGALMLEIMGWRERVRVLVGRNTPGAAAKPDPAAAHFALRALEVAPARAAMVGDTEFDMRCARDAGMALVIGVLGALSEAQLRAEGATHVVASLDALAPLLLDGRLAGVAP